MTERRAIQRFQIVERLGEGGMGTVFRARDPQLERDVAIKVLHRSDAPVRAALTTHRTVNLRRGGGARARDDLLHEARLMARLAHPNVVPIFEVGLDDAGDVFVVMEYVAGQDLRRWLATPRPAAEIARVLVEVARGIAAAHERGIVHRDLKPDNVLIGADGRARVTDFGLSRLVEAGGLVATARVAGTPGYMAPELWRGAPATAASDLYALCVTCIEALGDAARPSQRAVFERGLADDPGARPAIAELVAALEVREPRRRPHVAAAAIVVAALGAVGGTAGLALSTPDAPTCAADPGLLAGRWDPVKRAAFVASVRAAAPDAPAAERARLVARFDQRAAELARLDRAACEDQRAERLTAAQARARQACLAVRAVELGAVVDAQLAAPAPIAQLEIQLDRTALPASCAVVAVAPRDPRALAVAYARFVRADELAAPRAIAELAAIEAAAREAGDPELAVRAAVRRGARQRAADQLAASDDTLRRAYGDALAIASTEAATDAIAERLLTLRNSRELAQTKMLGELARELAGRPTTTPRTRLRLLRSIGLAAGARGETRAAIAVLREALADAARREPRDLDVEARLHVDVAEALLLRGEDVPQAIALAKRGVELARVQGERTNTYGLALNMLSKAYMLHHDVDDALAYRRRALAVFAAIFPADHSAVIEARVDLGVALVHASQFDAAHRELAAAVELARRSPALARSYPWMLSRLAAATAELGRGDDAARLYEQAIELLVSTVGADHPQTFNQRFNHAALLLELGRVDDAARAIAGLERGVARHAEPGDVRAPLVRGWLAADLALARGRAAEAEALARAAADALAELGAPVEATLARRRLGAALVAQGRHAEARAVIEPALAAARAAHLRADDVAGFELVLAAADAGLGHPAAARACAARLAPVLARYPGARRARAALARLRAP